MFLNSLLAVSEKTTETVKWISVVAVIVLLGVIALIGFARKKTFDAKQVAFAGVCVAMSFTLAVLRSAPYNTAVRLPLRLSCPF